MTHNQWFDDDSEEAQAYARVSQDEGHHKAHLSHELIAAAASYAAMKAYHNHCEKNGKPVSHAQAKEILAGLSGAFIDHLVETKGLDYIDREKVKHHAHEQLHHASRRDYPDYDYSDRDYRDHDYRDRDYRDFDDDGFPEHHRRGRFNHHHRGRG